MPDRRPDGEAADTPAAWRRRAEATSAALARARIEMGRNPNDPSVVKTYEDALAAHTAARRLAGGGLEPTGGAAAREAAAAREDAVPE